MIPTQAGAWGRDGHRVVAEIALRFMTPAARSQADALLAAAGGESLVAASDWADRIRRERRDTAPWHFVDIEVGSGPYVDARDCRGRSCVVDKIEDFRAELADRRLDPERRGEALKWLVHLVGDVHQPLHAADRHDKGGNALEVDFEGKERRLHEIWDVELVKLARGARSDAEYAAALSRSITPADRATWSQGSPAAWANESHELAERVAYGELQPGPRPAITAAYERDAVRVVDVQLERAGVRLAALLNGALR